MIRQTDRGKYDPVQLYYSCGHPDGVWISGYGLRFVLSQKDVLHKLDWCRATNYAKAINHRLPSVEEWMLIIRYKAIINRLLETIHGDIITSNYYWTSEETSNNYAKLYYGDIDIISDYNKHNIAITRTIYDS